MSVRELSWEERNRLYEMSTTSMIATFFAFLIWFVYLMHNELLLTTWNFLLKFVLPFIIGCCLAFMITFEVGYHMKVKSPWSFHLKRIGGQLILLLLGAFSFAGLTGLMDEVLSSTSGGRGFMVGSLIWALAFAAIIYKFRHFVAKLENGSW